MRPDEDLPGGERVDGEGMVYSLDSGTRTVYFCDRFRRYKFVGKAGGLALLQAMCTKNDICLGFNAKLFSTDPGVHSMHSLLRLHTLGSALSCHTYHFSCNR